MRRCRIINEFALGVEREVMANTSLGIRYVYRNIGRILEDVGDTPMVDFETHPGLSVDDDSHESELEQSDPPRRRSTSARRSTIRCTSTKQSRSH